MELVLLAGGALVIYGLLAPKGPPTGQGGAGGGGGGSGGRQLQGGSTQNTGLSTNNVGAQGGSDATAAIVTTVVSGVFNLAGPVIGLITKMLPSAASATAEAAAQTAVEVATAVGFDSGFALVGGLIAAVIIIYIVTDKIVSVVNAYHEAVTVLVGAPNAGTRDALIGHYTYMSGVFARTLWSQVVVGNPDIPQNYDSSGQVGNYIYMKKPPVMVGHHVIPATGPDVRAPIKDVVPIMRTMLYLGLQQCLALNGAMYSYYKSLGHTVNQMSDWGEGISDDDFIASVYPAAIQRWAREQPVVPGWPQSCVVDPYSADGSRLLDFSEYKFPTYFELQDGARRVIGTKNWSSVLVRARFIGFAQAITKAAIYGFTNTWPGDEEFVRGISERTVAWPVSKATYTTTTGEQLDTWWMVEPTTHWAIAPITSRERTAFIVSLPSPPPEAVTSYRGFSGLSRFGGSNSLGVAYYKRLGEPRKVRTPLTVNGTSRRIK